MITNIRQLDVQTGKTIENDFQFLADTYNRMNGKYISFKDNNEQNQIRVFQQNKSFYYQFYDSVQQKWGQQYEISPAIGFAVKTRFPLNETDNSYLQIVNGVFSILLNNQEHLRLSNNQLTLKTNQICLNTELSQLDIQFDFQQKVLNIVDVQGNPQIQISNDTLNVHNKRITGVADCVDGSDVVNNSYLQQYIQDKFNNLSLDTVPLGVILPLHGANIPCNYLLCDGQQFNQQSYPELFSLLGSNITPDLRGLFIRGLDLNGQNDPDGQFRQIGSLQQDDNKSHSHNYVDSTFVQQSQVQTNSQWSEVINGSIGPGINTEFVYRSPNGEITVNPTFVTTELQGSESRPKNIALNYIIKATQPHIGQVFKAPGGNIEMNGNSIVEVGALQMSDASATILTNNIQGVSDSFINIHTPVQIHGAFGYQIPESAQLDQSGVSIKSQKTAYASLICEQDIICNEINTLSSNKIKNVIDSDVTQFAQETLRKLQFYRYNYKDQKQFGTGEFYGVIAEDIRELLPNVVMDNRRFVPNIYKEAVVQLEDDHLVFTFESPLARELFDEEITDIRIITEQQNQQTNQSFCYICDLKVLQIKDSQIITSLCDKCHKLKQVTQTFVYGSYQNCLGVAKERLFELGLIVLQNLDKRVQQLQTKQQPDSLTDGCQSNNVDHTQHSFCKDQIEVVTKQIAELQQIQLDIFDQDQSSKQEIKHIQSYIKDHQETDQLLAERFLAVQDSINQLTNKTTINPEESQDIQQLKETIVSNGQKQEIVEEQVKVLKQQLVNRNKDFETLQKALLQFEKQLTSQQVLIEQLQKDNKITQNDLKQSNIQLSSAIQSLTMKQQETFILQKTQETPIVISQKEQIPEQKQKKKRSIR